MKITCPSCAAKYNIADDKIRGKTVRVKCKKCGSPIVISPDEGQQSSAETTSGGGPPLASETQAVWKVHLTEGEQPLLALDELQELYRTGRISNETYVAKDGVGEWVPLGQVLELQALMPERVEAQPPARAEADKEEENDEDMPTRVGASPFAPSPAVIASASAASSEEVTSSVALTEPTAVASTAAAPVAAARRDATRARAVVDIFATASSTDTEQKAREEAAGSQDKMTGARNENSVLFSLSAFGPGANSGQASSAGVGAARRNPPPDPTAPSGDASGLIDMRVLAGAAGRSKEATRRPDENRVDDIMNLGGAPIFAPALEAPLLAPAPLGVPASSVSANPAAEAALAAASRDAEAAPLERPKKRTGIWIGAIVGLSTLVGIGAFFWIQKNDNQNNINSVASAEPPSNPSAAGLSADAVKPIQANEVPAASASAGGSDFVAQGTATTTPEAASAAKKDDREKASADDHKKKHSDDTDKKKSIEKDEAVGAAPAQPAPVAPPPEPTPQPGAATGGEGGAFDRTAALSALGAVGVGSCKTPDGPSGSGRVAVTFAPSGGVTQAAVEGPPFAGTPVGSCIASKFRSAHVPPFGGAPITVKKSFSLQ